VCPWAFIPDASLGLCQLLRRLVSIIEDALPTHVRPTDFESTCLSMNQDLSLGVAPASQPVPSSAFNAHGIWTPGVLLMRRINFHLKALIITVIFLIPIMVAGWGLMASQQGQIDFSEKERQGAPYWASERRKINIFK